MANRKPSRLTERTHPRYRGSSSGPSTASGSTAGGDDSARRFAMIALGALALAAILLVGFMMRRGDGTPATAEPTAAAAVPTDASGLAVSTVQVPTAAAPAAPVTDKKTYTEAADQALDAANKSYFVTWETSKGTIEAELFPEEAPITVNSFAFLAREGFYDGLTFHRVVPDFVVQGGDPQGTGMGGPGYEITGEFIPDNPIPHSVGSLAMARSSDPDSAGSQFYFVLNRESAAQLDGSYAVFGQVTKGMDVVRQLAVGDVMTKVTIVEKSKAESITSADAIRAGTLPEGVAP
ncbi:MAG: peptidylprolyl isomerase [Ardenticatenales bacterium]|nr:peptidylprolyl isomerase [Ardenticatenales bacterium]